MNGAFPSAGAGASGSSSGGYTNGFWYQPIWPTACMAGLLTGANLGRGTIELDNNGDGAATIQYEVVESSSGRVWEITEQDVLNRGVAGCGGLELGSATFALTEGSAVSS